MSVTRRHVVLGSAATLSALALGLPTIEARLWFSMNTMTIGGSAALAGDGKRAATAASVTQFAYDVKGQLTQITDPLTHITTLAYYPTGLIHTITDQQSNVTSYEYDLRGNRTAVVDALTNRTEFQYDLGNRLMRQLMGQDHAPPREQLPDNAILIARAMGPAALLDYDRKRLRGLVLEEGTANSHVSIVARALGIPAVGEVPNAPGIADPGDAIIVDGTSGSIYVRPSAEIESAYAERVRFRARRQAQYSALRDKPCVTKDGQHVELLINAGLIIDLPHIDDTGSAGIGLFRTELQFMVGQSLPRTSDQLALYRAVLDAAGPKPVTFRTLDIGGDKALPYMETVVEENPALGWRAIRLGLDRPGLLRGQIRALLRAGGGRALKIMFPMISEVAEFDQAKAIVERELTYLRQHGHALPERIDVGTMVEVPALLYQMDELLKKVDFVSVGSNDLFQFLYAVDRGNAKVSERFDTMSAPILRALRDIVRKANAAKKGVSLCGEMASKPLGALALIALGYRSLSMSATGHGPVKAMILELDAKRAEAMMLPLLDAPSGSVSIRDKLTEFAEAEGLSL
jgi:phosphotransferase system enzyme I (PtsP)